MFLAILWVIGALGLSATQPSNLPAVKVPNMIPYNFTFHPLSYYQVDVNDLEGLLMSFDIGYKRARIVYSENNQVIGFDMYMRGTAKSIKPVLYGESERNSAKYYAVNLTLPISPSSWSSADVNCTSTENKYTRREKIMRNKYCDCYLKFRKLDGASYSETKALVDKLNKYELSLKGIKKVNQLLITTKNPNVDMLSDAFGKQLTTKIYLDAEYECLSLETAEKYVERVGLVFSFVVPWCIVPGLGSLVLFIALLKNGFPSVWVALSTLGLSFALTQILVWDCYAKPI